MIFYTKSDLTYEMYDVHTAFSLNNKDFDDVAHFWEF